MELYLDNSATTQPYPEVVKEINTFLSTYWGNPSAITLFGRVAKTDIENARQRVAKILNCEPDEIYFTSGGSESDNTFVKGCFKDNCSFITSPIEHPAIKNACKAICSLGAHQITLPILPEGKIDMRGVKQLEKLHLKEKPKFMTVMLINNETGMIQPIKELTEYFKSILPSIIIHTDAVQAAGKMKLDVKELGVDSLSLSGHKFGAPKGIGILYLKKGIECKPLIDGGGQEKGLRSGTENVPYIMGVTKALEITYNNLNKKLDEMEQFDKKFYDRITQEIPQAKLNSGWLDKACGIFNFRFEGINAQSLLSYLDYNGIYISAGSACHSDSEEPSYVLTAMGLSREEAQSSLRFSMNRPLLDSEMDYLIKTLKDGIKLQLNPIL